APQLDLGLGLQKIAKHYYFPGWHQPASWDTIIVNMNVWKSLPEKHQKAMIEACYANITFNTFDQINAQIDAIEKIEAAGVKVQRFPDAVLAALQKASTEVMEEEAKNDALFAEAYKSLTAYTKRVGRWGDLQALPRSN
ncbi:MAG: hypothetical protein ACK4Z4_10350, partial [Ferrovibrio sp.]